MKNYGQPYSERGRGLLLSITHDLAEVAFFVLKKDPQRRHRVATQHWARENGVEVWP